MASLDLSSLTKRYGDHAVVADVTLAIPDGEFLVLLGPSGCGKTTTLRMIAGFVPPTSGAIRIGDRDITDLPPWQRNAGLVFQSYALFPHMTVADNVAFGLDMRKVEAAETKRRVAEALDLVRLGALGGRYPRQLSGGQQQRVALARALAIRPDVLLLDEPLSNLDAKLRQDVRVEIRELQRRLRLTTVMVTHDQEEALTMADRLVVMADGRVRQVGTQRDLYERPVDRFVTDFVGRSTFLEGRVTAPGEFVTAGGIAVRHDGSAPAGPASIALRPERVVIGDAATQMPNAYSGTVEFVSYLGSALDIHVRLSDQDHVIAQTPNRPGGIAPSLGDRIALGWSTDAGKVFADPGP